MKNMLTQANVSGMVSFLFNSISIATSFAVKVGEYVPIVSGIIGVTVGLFSVAYYAISIKCKNADLKYKEMQIQGLICTECHEIKPECEEDPKPTCKHV